MSLRSLVLVLAPPTRALASFPLNLIPPNAATTILKKMKKRETETEGSDLQTER